MALNIIKIIILNCDIKQTERHDGIITILCMCRLKRPKIKKKKLFAAIRFDVQFITELLFILIHYDAYCARIILYQYSPIAVDMT